MVGQRKGHVDCRADCVPNVGVNGRFEIEAAIA